MPKLHARAKANANIALSKYWGKADDALNLPAVPSISLTLSPLETVTEVTFDEALQDDLLILDDHVADEPARTRVSRLLDLVRAKSGVALRARVQSRNHFPTAAGLASSASGFAALSVAATAAAGLQMSAHELSALARRGSASAARSLFGGWVELPRGAAGNDTLSAQPLAPADHWPMRVIVVQTTDGPKALSSRRAMKLVRETSPYYDAWLHAAPRLSETIREAILTRDLQILGPAMEQSFGAMHACGLAANPRVLYWTPDTVRVLGAVSELRDKDGLQVYATMDAGPHVKAFCMEADARMVAESLKKVAGVRKVLEASPGRGAHLVA